MEKYSLVGIDGNAYSVMGYVTKAMKEVGFSKEEQDKYLTDAKSSDYDHLLAVSIGMIDQCNDKAGVEDYEDYED